MDRTRFADLARSLAWQLGELRGGETWTAELPEGGGTYGALAGPGHARLGLSWGYREDKLTVRGNYPEGTGGTAYRARVDPQRGLLTIAKDINRRILAAGYVDVLLLQVERKATMDATEAERAGWLAKAAALFGIDPPAGTDDIGRRRELPQLDLSRFVQGRGHAESYYDGSGHLNITLSGIPAQVALDMLRVLAGSEENRARCCFTYGPYHPPQFAVAGCLYRHCAPSRGEVPSRKRVQHFLVTSRGLDAGEVTRAMDEAKAKGAAVIDPDGQVQAVITWNHEGCGEYTVEVPREAS